MAISETQKSGFCRRWEQGRGAARSARAPLARAALFALALLGSAWAPSVARGDEDEEADRLRKELDELRLRVDGLEQKMDEAEQPSDMHVFYKKGLRFESRDGAFKWQLNGVIDLDWSLQSGDRDLDDYIEANGDDLEDGVAFRRGRIDFRGTLYDRYFYRAAYDFAGGDADFYDVYMGATDLPLDSTLRIGHFKEPFSYDSISGHRDLLFIERSLVQALSPYRNTGMAVNGIALNERATWSVGAFYNTDTYGDGGGDGDLSGTARVTCLPWRGGDDQLFHLGASYSRRGEDELRIRTTPESRVAPDFVDTGRIETDGADLAGGETAMILGPFTAQAEYVRMDMDAPVGDDPVPWGFYVAGAFLLTGEHRNYREDLGALGEVTPASNFLSSEGGTGAWEVAARYSRLDLDDTALGDAGDLADYTLGLNWYPNPMIRVSANYIHSHLSDTGTAHIFLMRFGLMF